MDPFRNMRFHQFSLHPLWAQGNTWALPPKFPPPHHGKGRGINRKIRYLHAFTKGTKTVRDPQDIDVAIPCNFDTSQNRQFSSRQAEIMSVKRGNNRDGSVPRKNTILLCIFCAQPLQKQNFNFSTGNCQKSLRNFEGERFSKTLILALVQNHLTIIWEKASEN